MGRNPPANAGNTSSISDPGRFHMPWATKPMHHISWTQATTENLCSAAREAPAPQQESSPCLLQLQKACVQQQRPSVTKKKKELWNLKTGVKNGPSSASTSMKPHRHLQNLRHACMKPSPLTNTGLFQPFLLERRKLRPSRVKRFAQDHTSMGRKMRTKSSSFHLLR